MDLAFARGMNFLRTISQRFTVQPWATSEEKHFVFNPRQKNTILSELSSKFYNRFSRIECRFLQ